MYVHIYVSPSEAVRQGKTRSGLVVLNLTPEDLAQLSEEERAELAQSAGLGKEQLEPSLTPLGRSFGDADVAEATVESLRTLLQRRMIRRAKEEAEKQERVDRIIGETEGILRKRETRGHSERVSVMRDKDGAMIGSAMGCDMSWTRRLPAWPYDAHEVPESRAIIDSAEGQEWIAELAAENAKREAAAKEKALARWDERVRKEEQEAAEQKKAEEEKTLFEAAVKEAVVEWGDSNQQARQKEGLLSWEAAVTVVRDHLFADLAEEPRYSRLEAEEVECECYEPQIEFSVTDAQSLSAKQWDAFTAIRKCAPAEAIVTTRTHIAECTECEKAVVRFSVHVAIEWHGRRLSREYALLPDDSA